MLQTPKCHFLIYVVDKKSLTNTLESLVCITQYKQIIPIEAIC